jgi:hypothetical protein
MFIIVIVIIAAFLSFDLYYRFYKPVVATKSWPELAKRTGLAFQPPTGSWSNRSLARVTGTYRGYALKLDTPRVVPGPVDDGIAMYRTRIVLTMNQPVTGSLSLKHRWFFSRGFLRGEGQQIGDALFDQRFIIHSRPADYAGQIFAAKTLRQRFLAEKEIREFSLSNLGVRCEIKGILSDVKKLHDLFNLLADVVQTVKSVEQR